MTIYMLPYNTPYSTVLDELNGMKREDEPIAETQQKLAEKYGFPTWSQLKVHTDPPTLENPDFQHFACLTYSVNDRPFLREKAMEMLTADPSLGTRDIYSACITGNVEVARRALKEQPELVNARGGTNDWEPLLYAAYSRIADAMPSTLEVGRLLLEHGANPDAYYMWGGGYRFTALTGVFGEGEQGPINQPEHVQMLEFAKLLLDAGASPNDSQALYNRMFKPDNTCLKLLLEYGLNNLHTNNWFIGKGDKLVPHGQRTLIYQMQWAVKNNMVERVRLLVDHGVDVNEKLEDGMRPLKEAQLRGFVEIRDFLNTRGATNEQLDKVEQFVAECMSTNRESVNELLERDSKLVDKTQKRFPQLLSEAASHGLTEQVQYLLELGFDKGLVDSQSPLHEAAINGHLDLVKELVEVHACDIHLSDRRFGSTPLGWANQSNQTDVMAYLMSLDLDIFVAIAFNLVDRVTKIIDENPKSIERTLGEYMDAQTFSEIRWQTPLAYAAFRSHTEIVRILLAAGASTSVVDFNGKSLVEILNEEKNVDMVQLLKDS